MPTSVCICPSADTVHNTHMTVDVTKTASPEELWSSDDASRLSRLLYLGTSTWAFPGWKGVVYKRQYKSQAEFTRESLSEYASIPWFRTVCIDNLFYNPPKTETLERYASQTPEHFKWISKVWERITIISYPKHARYGANAGRPNPDFLSFELFRDAVLRPYQNDDVLKRIGPLVLQFAPFSPKVLPYEQFIERLAEFLAKLPKDFS